MSIFTDAMKTAASAVHDRIGSLCFYTHEDGQVTESKIIVKRNQPVRDDFGMIAGYQDTASILKSDICKVNNLETFIDTELDIVWQVVAVTKKTSAKFYVDIIEIDFGDIQY